MYQKCRENNQKIKKQLTYTHIKTLINCKNYFFFTIKKYGIWNKMCLIIFLYKVVKKNVQKVIVSSSPEGLCAIFTLM